MMFGRGESVELDLCVRELDRMKVNFYMNLNTLLNRLMFIDECI